MAFSGSLNFLSASDFGSWHGSTRWGATRQGAAALSSDFTPVDFVGLNTLLYENVTGSTNTLGSTNISYTSL